MKFGNGLRVIKMLIKIKNLFDKYCTDDLHEKLLELRKHEPKDSKQRHILRGCIMGYELGAVQQAIKQDAQENLDPNIKKGYIENGKLGMADLITQLKMLCLDMGWDYKEIERLGVEHLVERHEDFKKEGWAEK